MNNHRTGNGTVVFLCPKSQTVAKGVFYIIEQQKILNKIEQLVEKLPYKSVHIELVLQDQTLTLSKDRCRPIGFFAEEKTPK